MRFKFVLSSLVLFGSVEAVLASGLTVPQLVVFGDSLSDTGNAAFGTGGLLPGPATNYTAGRFTDGNDTIPSSTAPVGIWVDQVSSRLGITDPMPAFAPAGGTNFAVGSATTGSNPSFPGILQAPGVDQQLGAYLTAVGNQSSATALYSFWAGANDLKSNTSPAAGIQAADNIYQNILTLAGTGARNFLWFNLPSLGALPGVQADGPVAVALANAASDAFNSEWQKDLYLLTNSGILVAGVDVESLFNRVEADFESGCTVGPADPYCFANISGAAQGNALVDPNTYLFWDGEHPTTTGQALVADLAYTDIQAIPEPSETAFISLGFGMLAVLFAARKLKAVG